MGTRKKVRVGDVIGVWEPYIDSETGNVEYDSTTIVDVTKVMTGPHGKLWVEAKPRKIQKGDCSFLILADNLEKEDYQEDYPEFTKKGAILFALYTTVSQEKIKA